MSKAHPPRPGSKLLLATAKAIAAQAKHTFGPGRVRILKPARPSSTKTDGWSVLMGDLGKGQPRLELWFDRFAGHTARKFYIGFVSKDHKQIAAICKSVAAELVPVRQVHQKDITKGKVWQLTFPLKCGEFNAPIHEQYQGGNAYFGIFDRSLTSTQGVNPYFCDRAVSFIEDVVAALPALQAEDHNRKVYPRTENRKRVAAHLRRERSHLLATECKMRDDYCCRVCGFRFADLYGALGRAFAEAHHRVALGELGGKVVTQLKDLVTVCANCHRMLHRMAGKRDDITNLRRLVRQNRKAERRLAGAPMKSRGTRPNTAPNPAP